MVAVDTGTSHRHGLALLDGIARVTRAPVRRVLITHARQEFVFGALAYRERGIEIHMHAKAAALMRARCEGCLKTLRSVLGDHEMQQTALLAGSLLNQGRIPDIADIADSDHGGWRRALAALRSVSAETISPGHSAAGTTHVIEPIERYLNALEACVTRLLESGVGLSEIADRAALPEFASWDQYPTIHRRNASVLYLRLESR